MRKKYHIAGRFLLLILVSTGIFISSFHSHSDLEWHHPEEACPTGTHLTVNALLCPVCGFHLNGTPAKAPSLTATQTVVSVIGETDESIVDETFNGPLNGRSPPFIV